MIAYTISQQGNEITLQCSTGENLTTSDWNDAIPFCCIHRLCGGFMGWITLLTFLQNLLDKKLKDKVMRVGEMS